MYWDQFSHLSCSTEVDVVQSRKSLQTTESLWAPFITSTIYQKSWMIFWWGWVTNRNLNCTEAWIRAQLQFFSFSGQDHSPRLLQVGAELIQELRGQFVVHQAPVAGQSDGHQLLGAKGLLVLAQPQLRPGGPHGQDAWLRRVDDGAEAADTEHPQVRYAAAGTSENVTQRGEKALAISGQAQQGKNT